VAKLWLTHSVAGMQQSDMPPLHAGENRHLCVCVPKDAAKKRVVLRFVSVFEGDDELFKVLLTVAGKGF